jgi:hypothetical protein
MIENLINKTLNKGKTLNKSRVNLCIINKNKNKKELQKK